MIYQRLSDNERTLLSAYFDGEVSPAERGKAEALLAGSEEAQAYLGEIRTVKRFSVEAFPPVMGGAAAGSIAARISGNAISTAAQKTSLLKTLFSGPWGLAGAAAAAATIVTAVSLSIDSGPVKTTGPEHPKHSRSAVVRNAVTAAPPSFDTNGIVVPAMTPPELVRFAVEGTLPLDRQRDQYLTIQPKGADSFVVNVGCRTQTNLEESLKEISSGSLAGLDTVQRAIRSTVKAMSNGTIGIRNDFLAQRYRLLDSLENRRFALPDPLHLPLRTARRRLEDSRALATVTARTVPAIQSQDMDDVAPNEHSFSLIVINGELRRSEGLEYHIPAAPFIVSSETSTCFMLGPKDMATNFQDDELGRPVTPIRPVTVSVPSESSFAIVRDHVNSQRRNSMSAGEKPPTGTTVSDREQPEDLQEQPSVMPPPPHRPPVGIGSRPLFPNGEWNDEGADDLQELLRHAEHEINRADSIIRMMQIRMNQESTPNRAPNVDAGDSGSKPNK